MGPHFFGLSLALRQKTATKTVPSKREYWRYCEGAAPGKDLHYFRPGTNGRRHVITAIIATLKMGGTQLLTAQDEGQLVLRNYCHGSLVVVSPLPIRSGKAAAVTLHCTDDPENVASLTIWGYTGDRTPEEDDVLP